MEAWLVAIGAVLGLGVVGFVALRERRALDRIARVVGARPGADPVSSVTALREQATQAETAKVAIAQDRVRFLESLELGVLTVDDRLRIAEANGAAHALLDRAPGGLVGRSLIEVFGDIAIETIAHAALDGRSATGEIALAGPDGPKVVVRARRTPTGGLWIVLEDVSELRRLQQIRTQFIDNLSHELRTPLTTVGLLAETLARDADAAGDAVPQKMRDRIGKIEVETGHLVQMVSELLDLSRIESGSALGVLDLLDLGAIATVTTERLRLFAERQGVNLHVDIAMPVPPARGDEARLGQVLVNLLHNAVKFSPDGGEVRVTVRVVTSDVVVAVTDHGVGIPEASQARIFERFYKVDRARVRGETAGTGLGLAIARHIIEQHGGRIWVESSEGMGSTFSFSLPIAADAT